MDKKQFTDFISKSDKESVVKSLAIGLGLGGIYAEQLVALTKVDKNKKPAELDANEIKQLFDASAKLRDMKLNPVVYKQEGKVKDICPIEIKAYSGLDAIKVGSFNTAIDKFITDIVVSSKVSQHEEKIKKLKSVINAQEMKLKEFEKQEIEERQKAKLIYSNYKVIEEVLKEINKATAKYSFKEIK